MTAPLHHRPNPAIQHSRSPLVQVPKKEWAGLHEDPYILEVWRSRAFLVQVFAEPGSPFRMSVQRIPTRLPRAVPLRSPDGISWDDLQWIKAQVGFGELCGVEVYPPEDRVHNVANLRHVWLLDRTPTWVWDAAEAPR